MDQFSAHLDRGWDLVQRGDALAAEQSARRALELDAQSPEAFNLLGYAAAMQGEFEDAIEYYRTALSLDDTYLEAMLNAAEVYIHPIGDFDSAVDMCEQALELAENDDEVVDAQLLMFDALMAKGEFDAAKALTRRFPAGPFENPNHTFLVGRALYEVSETDRALPLVESVLAAQPKHSEALYYLGLIRDEHGEAAQATEAFLRSRELDLELLPPPWAMSREAFELKAKAAAASLSPEYKQFLREGEVYVSDVPGVEVVVDGVDPRALLLLDGVPGDGPDDPPKARVFVYQRNVERIAGLMDELEQEIVAALEREITLAFVEVPPSQPADRGLN
ncbi:MAG: tetratricopeptide repeat protein [Polyangiaceae bacterium]|nr:tetratricopeptide repeat protein [Polyangiaceae bacterium]MCK6534840.1 tetratricopeptide repeat protein [Polyangiaceae bacterium]